MPIITFTVGDWRYDGHGMCASFYAQSSLPVQDLRELHYQAKDVLGFAIGDICCDPDDAQLSEDERAILTEAGLLEGDTWPDFPDVWEPEDVARLWMDILVYVAQQTGTPLSLTPMGEEEVLGHSLAEILRREARAHGLDPEAAPLLAAAVIERLQGTTSPITATPANGTTLHFYGHDSQGRHLCVPGYGTFFT